MGELQFSEPMVEDMCEELGLSEKTTKAAKAQARRVDRTHPINRSPRAIAAASVYFQCLMNNEKRTQAAVCEVAGVGEHTIRNAYREIAKAEGLPIDGGGSGEAEKSAGSTRVYHSLWPQVKRTAKGLAPVLIIAGGIIVTAFFLTAMLELQGATPAEFERAAEEVAQPDYGSWDLLVVSIAAAFVAVVIALLISVPKRWPRGGR